MDMCKACGLSVMTQTWVMGQGAIKEKQTVIVKGKPKERNVVIEKAKPGYWKTLDVPETEVFGNPWCGTQQGVRHIVDAQTREGE